MTRDYLHRLADEHPYIFGFLDQLTDALYVCDTKGRLIYLNRSAQLLDGYSIREIYGKHVREAYGLDETSSPLLRALTTGTPVVNSTFRYFVNGREVYQICNASPILYRSELIGAYTIQSDVTNMKEIIEKNISLQQQLFGGSGIRELRGLPAASGFERLLGEHPLFVECRHLAELASKSESAVFLTGETGSGKEMFARCIHEASTRRNGPFLAINCAAIPETLIEGILFGTSKGIYTGAVERAGLFEQAAGGTLFLDEINSMPLESQAKLLRALEEKTVQHLGSNINIRIDARIISSSNTPPGEAIQKQQIREDLFYRLAVINIMIPSLAERGSDIFLLTNHFISHYNKLFDKHVMELDDEVLAFFLEFDWPGNVRQLKHCIESAMNFVDEKDFTIQKRHLPHYLVKGDPVLAGGYRRKTREPKAPAPRLESASDNSNVFDTIRQREKESIISALMTNGGNVTRAAKSLGLTRQALIYRIKKYDIK